MRLLLILLLPLCLLGEEVARLDCRCLLEVPDVTELDTLEEVEEELCCLQGQIERLRRVISRDQRRAQQLLFIDFTDARHFTEKALAEEEVLCQLEQVLVLLEERRDYLIHLKQR